MIIGDLDSVTSETLNTFSKATIVRRPEQETTDLHKALEYLENRGAEKVVIFGGTGERPDHFFGNMSLFLCFKGKLDLEFIDPWCSIRLINGDMTLTGKPGQSVSLWPLSGDARGVTTTGLKYPLDNETLLQDTRGISNELCAKKATIKIRSGDVLVIMHHPA